jgi:hypothetical protein
LPREECAARAGEESRRAAVADRRSRRSRTSARSAHPRQRGAAPDRLRRVLATDGAREQERGLRRRTKTLAGASKALKGKPRRQQCTTSHRPEDKRSADLDETRCAAYERQAKRLTLLVLIRFAKDRAAGSSITLVRQASVGRRLTADASGGALWEAAFMRQLGNSTGQQLLGTWCR